jgi:hypothetical protein
MMSTESGVLISLYIRLLQSAPNVYIRKTNSFVLESIHGPLLEPVEENCADQRLRNTDHDRSRARTCCCCYYILYWASVARMTQFAIRLVILPFMAIPV